MVKSGRLNAIPDHLSHVVTDEEPNNIDDGFPDVQLFRVDVADDHYAPIIHFMSTGVTRANMLTSHKK